MDLTDLRIRSGLHGALTVADQEKLTTEEFKKLVREILK